jgi:phage terminase large subunit-like protein
MALNATQERELRLRQVEIVRRLGGKFRTYFPDCLPGCTKTSARVDDHVTREGFARPICRVLYPKSLQFLAAGAVRNPDDSFYFNERMFLAANRTGKTVTAAYETTAHLTGDYPKWWCGATFSTPISAWAAGDTLETTRNVIQLELSGPRELLRNEDFAGGMIPAHRILDRTWKSGGVPDCLDTLWIRWGDDLVHGGPATSTLEYKAYNQGRLTFQGTSKHLVWLDEEPPDAKDEPASGGGTPSGNGDIYTECLLRTATTGGIVLATFTPLRGLTPFIDHYLETAYMCDADGNLINAKVGLFGVAA